MMRAKSGLARRLLGAAVAAACTFTGAACSRKPAATLTEVRPVMAAFLERERIHRASHGNFWRDHQPKVNRDEAVRQLGVDIQDAASFEFTIEPADSGMDPVLRISARSKGEPSVTLACVQDAQSPKADCQESTAGG